MTDARIIDMYTKGYSIDYIAKVYCKYKNRKQKPIVINGIVCYPQKIYTKGDCLLYVHSLIYHYIITRDNIPLVK